MLRIGECSAWSASMMPVSTSIWTMLWSCVSWHILPSRIRYARESPTSAMYACPAWTKTAVSVAPIFFDSRFAVSHTARWACWMASFMSASRGVSGRRVLHRARERLDDERARDLAGLGAAHAVGDGQEHAALAHVEAGMRHALEERAAREVGDDERVLVLLAHLADVGLSRQRSGRTAPSLATVASRRWRPRGLRRWGRSVFRRSHGEE